MVKYDLRMLLVVIGHEIMDGMVAEIDGVSFAVSTYGLKKVGEEILHKKQPSPNLPYYCSFAFRS